METKGRQKDKMKGAGDLGSYCATKLFPTRITGVIVYVCIACCLLSYTTSNHVTRAHM